MWGTPVARDDQKSPETEAQMWRAWGTPRASDGARGTDPLRTNEKAGGPTLKSQVTAFPLDPRTPPDGPTGAPRVDLNPEFVGSLMGLPSGWLSPSISGATDSSPNAPEPHGTNSPHDWSTE